MISCTCDAGSETLANAMSLIRLLVTVVLFAIAAIMVLDNLGVNVTGLIAGLGIGGIAIGLAARRFAVGTKLDGSDLLRAGVLTNQRWQLRSFTLCPIDGGEKAAALERRGDAAFHPRGGIHAFEYSAINLGSLGSFRQRWEIVFF